MSLAGEEKAIRISAVSQILNDIEYEESRVCCNHKCSELEKGMMFKDGTRYFCDAKSEVFKKCDSRIVPNKDRGDKEL